MTPAVDQLVQLGITHQLRSYDHDPSSQSYGTEAAEALGLDPDSVFKTLLVQLSGRHSGRRPDAPDLLVVALVPVTGRLDLKALARVAGAKKAEMAPPALAERTTGYIVGGMSPFGQKKRLETYVEETIELLDIVNVSGGRRGLEIGLRPEDLISVLEATVAPLAI